MSNCSGRAPPASTPCEKAQPCSLCFCRLTAQGSMAPAYTPIRGPFLKHAFAKSVDKGEDAWLQQRDLPCADGTLSPNPYPRTRKPSVPQKHTAPCPCGCCVAHFSVRFAVRQMTVLKRAAAYEARHADVALIGRAVSSKREALWQLSRRC